MFFWNLTFFFLYASNSQAETLKTIAERIDQEWQNWTLQHSLDLDTTIPLGGFGSLSTGLAYHYTVTPAYVRDQHQRIDSYSLRLGAQLSTLPLGVGRSGEAQISFSRLFSRKNKALLAAPRSPNRFPFQSQQALTDLPLGSAARLELASDGHISAGAQSVLDFGLMPLPAQLSASVRRGKRTLVDVYRLDRSRLRVRLTSTRTMGSFGITGALTPLTEFNFGSEFVEGVFDRLFRCRLITLEKETPLLPSLPVDTVMSDYVVDLATPLGQQTYDALFEKIKDINPQEHLGVYETPEEFESAHGAYSHILDAAFQSQKSIPNIFARSVHRHFKGRALTDFRRVRLGSDCFQLWDVQSETFHGTTSVREFDENEMAKDYLYLGTQQLRRRDFLLSFLDEEHSLGFNTLFQAQREEALNPLSLRPTALSDLVVVRSFKDKKFYGNQNPFFKNEILLFKKDIQYQYPQFFSRINWSDFVKTKQVAYSRLELIFDRRSVEVIRLKQLTQRDLKIHLEYYIQGYIQKVHPSLLSTTGGGTHHDPQGGFDRFKKDIQRISERLALIFSPQADVRTAVKALSSLRKNPLFQDIGAGFILTLLPAQEVASLVEATLIVGAQNTPTIEVISLSSSMTHLYREVEQILSTINDRSFDLRLQKSTGAFEN